MARILAVAIAPALVSCGGGTGSPQSSSSSSGGPGATEQVAQVRTPGGLAAVSLRCQTGAEGAR